MCARHPNTRWYPEYNLLHWQGMGAGGALWNLWSWIVTTKLNLMLSSSGRGYYACRAINYIIMANAIIQIDLPRLRQMATLFFGVTSYHDFLLPLCTSRHCRKSQGWVIHFNSSHFFHIFLGNMVFCHGIEGLRTRAICNCLWLKINPVVAGQLCEFRNIS